MKASFLKRWAALSGVLGVGMIVGLVLAGSWNITPSGLAEGGDRIIPASTISEAVPAQGQIVASVPPELQKTAQPSPGSAAEGLPSTRLAASKVRPAVVSVEVTKWQQGRNLDFHLDMPGFPEQFRDLIPQGQGNQQPQRVEGHGSGFIFTDDGYIITNNHVVDGAEELQVVLPDKRRYDAKVVGSDDITDVAVIKIDPKKKLPYVQLGDSESLQIGDWVLAIGNPLEFDYTVTAGIVSAKGRTLQGLDPNNNMIQNFIQTDAVINRGNSGGPLVDLNGNVVGINSAIASSNSFYEGYGFAIPINLARSVASDLIKYGEVRRGYLGIRFNEVDAAYARAISLPDDPPIGAVVQTVVPGGSADEAGIRPEDVILSIDGKEITNSGQLQTIVSTVEPGTTIDMEIYRGGSSEKVGEHKRVKVKLQERPREESAASSRPRSENTSPLGMDVQDLTRQDARQLGFDGKGVVVTGSEQYGPAFDAGIGRGAVIVSVDGKPTPDTKTFERVVKGLKSGSVVLVRIFVPNSQTGSDYASVPVEVR